MTANLRELGGKSLRCKEDGEIFDTTYDAFRHNLSHGRLAMPMSQLLDHFEVVERV